MKLSNKLQYLGSKSQIMPDHFDSPLKNNKLNQGSNHLYWTKGCVQVAINQNPRGMFPTAVLTDKLACKASDVCLVRQLAISVWVLFSPCGLQFPLLQNKDAKSDHVYGPNPTVLWIYISMSLIFKWEYFLHLVIIKWLTLI